MRTNAKGEIQFSYGNLGRNPFSVAFSIQKEYIISMRAEFAKNQSGLEPTSQTKTNAGFLFRDCSLARALCNSIVNTQKVIDERERERKR